MPQERIAEIRLESGFDLNQSISDIEFYYNLSRQDGKKVIVEIWRETPCQMPEEQPQSLKTLNEYYAKQGRN